MINKRIQSVFFLFIILTLALSACLRPDVAAPPEVPAAPPAAATNAPASRSDNRTCQSYCHNCSTGITVISICSRRPIYHGQQTG